jgi:signal transduction histidine kinase
VKISLITPRLKDEDARRREYILNIILVFSIGMLVLFDALVGYYAAKGHPSGTPFAVFSLLPAFFILLYALSRRGFVALASYLLVAAYFIGNSYAAYHWGVNIPTAVLGYALLIVIGSILISTRFGFFLTGIITVYVLAIWYDQLDGIMTITSQRLTIGDGVAIVVLYVLIVVVAWLSNREIERSLARARRSEQNLEAKVEERTRELQAAQSEKIDHLYRFAEFGQLASGLFHDLLNVVNAAALHDEKTMHDARTIQAEIERFRKTFRDQLNRDAVRRQFSLRHGVDDVIQLLSYQAKRAGVRVAFECPPDDAFEFFGNPFKFNQVVLNLLLNAIESFEGTAVTAVAATAGAKEIWIRLAREREDVSLRVEDNGSGIADELREKIFEPFFTTKSDIRRGTGIGLAITKRIVEEDFGGSISIAHGRDGVGSVFVARFPFRQKSYGSTHGAGDDEAMHRDRPESPAS